jgi:hypothetical protein
MGIGCQRELDEDLQADGKLLEADGFIDYNAG